MAVASASLMRGLLRTRSSSCCVRIGGIRWMVKLSTPTLVSMVSVTYSFMPWMSDTTAMIDVTATMLPSTVMNDRSFEDQIASSAMSADSMNLFMAPGLEGQEGPAYPDHPVLLLGFIVHLHQIAVGHAANRVVRSGDHF